MSLICITCGNKEFFESDVETVMEVEVSDQNLLVQPATMEDWNYAEESIRNQVNDNVISTLRMDADELREDYYSGALSNNYLQCAVCHSGSVCRPLSNWQPPKPTIDLETEMTNNRKALIQLRKARKHDENNLPVLWQQF